MEIEQENPTQDIKLYSQKSIGIATFIGGPIAAGYLVMKNFIELDKPDDGKKAFIIGVLSTIVLYIGIFMIPEVVLDKIPNAIIPAVYTLIIYLIVEKLQGKELNEHKLFENQFVSVWKAVKIGVISLFITIAGVFAYVYYGPESAIYDEYDAKLVEFYENEKESLIFYQDVNYESPDNLIHKLDNEIIPKWERNIEIIKESNRTQDLPQDLIERNVLLMDYALLRIEAFKLFRKVILEDTDEYIPELERIHKDIDKKLKEIESLSLL
jgi:hypothetical protein